MRLRKIAVPVLAVLGLGAALAVPARAVDAILGTALTGAAEVQGGDPDATGSATVYIDDDTNRLCLSLRFSGVDGTLTGLHIHAAPVGVNGPVVVPFAVPASTSLFQCLGVANEALLDDISVNPQNYYLNLHSTAYPAGAIRGQLAHE